MDMKVVVGTTPPNHLPPSIDHMNQANSNCSTPYMSAASSPQRHHHCGHRPQLDFFYYSAPTSPRSSSSHFNNHHSFFDDDNVYDDYSADHVSLLKHGNSSVTVPFNWELEPGVAKNDHSEVKKDEEDEEKEDFEFEFSGQLDMMVRPSLSSADELFDGGKIRPLKLPSPPNLRIIHDHNNNKISTTSGCTFSPKSPKSAMSKFKDALSSSPKHRRNGSDIDPFETAIRNTRETNDIIINNRSQERGRGRERAKPITPANTNNNNNKRGSNNKGMSRSLSPLRVSEFALLDHHHQQLQDNQQQNSNETSNLARILGMGFPSSSKKWRLKDLFLFRSASEGHYKDSQSYSKRWSCRSSTVGSVSGSESGSVSKRRGQQASASAHEMHYTSNRAVSEEMKKKTNLPYKHGLLACLGFSPVLPQFSYTFPSSTSTPFS
ncbi:hypothetical protein BVRB_9g218690 [Beta vulgaris subsp. vulgaris]|uniref:uncharacterized protein LOC104904471 n=1 Tax=Beta vulgaris subsp. vulgaris TaxID=3555 RepID=UPI00053FEACE|nr:uncharacterized protein LOC104904471 [Beta vulgaris subsp. vulgaris]KMT00571.1 hypothetical protein BVRB_9g218690 [Beta vulgaris subsp. vulgaris]